MVETTLGSLAPTDAGRDAIHIAVMPVMAAQILMPGDHIGFFLGSVIEVIAVNRMVKGLGIVDPFLTAPVQVGERFLMVLYPRTITGLTHVWTHPDIPSPAPRNITDAAFAQQVLTRFGNRVGWSYDNTVERLTDYAESGFQDFSNDEGIELDESVWDALEAITGMRCVHRTNYFSCAC